MWRLAKSLVRLREQINAMFPNRDKASDGSVGDLSHRARKSDHNPNAANVVTAIDVDENLTGPDGNAFSLVNALQASRDRRIKYIIYERRITVKGDITRWKPYTGPSPHDHHFHISVSSDPKLYDDSSDWQLNATVTPASALPVAHPTLKYGVKGEQVKELQRALIKNGFNVLVDGDYGRGTEQAVKFFQHKKGLTEDGICGPNTWAALGV